MNELIINEAVEKLLDKQNIRSISDYVRIEHPIRYQRLIDQGSVLYAFWLSNADRIAGQLNRVYWIPTKSNGTEKYEWNWNLNEDKILLYVGKTTDLRARIPNHLMLGTYEWDHDENGKLWKKTTSCQLRSGIEQLLKFNGSNSISFVNDRIGMTTVKLNDLGDRFYAEDLAIGLGKPWFNIDSER